MLQSLRNTDSPSSPIRSASVRLAAGVLGLCLMAGAASAMTVRPMAFSTIVQDSDTIVHGVVTKVVSGEDPVTGLICTWTTVKVIEGLKGKSRSSELTYKQFGGVDKARGIHFDGQRAVAIPGHEILLCLYPKSRSGLTSPVGHQQGIFRVKIDAATKGKYIDNGVPSAVLFPKTKEDPTKTSKQDQAAGREALDQCRSLKLDDVKKGIAEFVTAHKSVDGLTGIQKAKLQFLSGERVGK